MVKKTKATPIQTTEFVKAKNWEGSVCLGNDLLLSDQINKAPMPSEPRKMNFILIGLCTKGCIKYRMNTQEVTVHTGEMLVVSERQTKRYLMFDDEMRLHGWTNIETGQVKGNLSTLNSQLSTLRKLAFSGIHVFHPSLVPLLDEWPDRFPIMDFYLKACGTHLIRGYEAKDLRLLDVGKLDTLDNAEKFIKSL